MKKTNRTKEQKLRKWLRKGNFDTISIGKFHYFLDDVTPAGKYYREIIKYNGQDLVSGVFYNCPDGQVQMMGGEALYGHNSKSNHKLHEEYYWFVDLCESELLGDNRSRQEKERQKMIEEGERLSKEWLMDKESRMNPPDHDWGSYLTLLLMKSVIVSIVLCAIVLILSSILLITSAIFL